MRPGTKLLAGGLVVGGVTAYMAYVGASASWQYYLTADECVADASTLIGQRIRVNGRVVPGSLKIDSDRTQATFLLRGTGEELPVRCSGPLPDNLAEDIDVVVEGRLDEAGRFQGDKLLTRCASKYESQKKQESKQPSSTAAGTAAGGGA
jgi:cytochrome c-type biogenesis protein CcmE